MNTRLRELRNERNLTLRDLSEKVNISYSNIAMIERGERNLTADTLQTFSTFFNVSADYLLGLSDKRKPEPTTTSSPKEQLKGVKLAFYNQAEEISDEQAKEVLSFIEFIKNRDQNK